MAADGAAHAASAPPQASNTTSRFHTRWRLVGAGLSNVWRFGNLELPAPTGRLLLRGPNGTGKTTALEALAPYLLDLNAARMSAGKSRTTNLASLMREGASGKRRHGYAWLTAASHESDVLSFGVRLQYSEGASPPVRVMPFVVPGRPLHELTLHGPAGTALSHEQFAENVTACGGEIFDSDEDYIPYLASRLFGLRDSAEIAALTSRLRQIRNPTLLGDISPQAAAEALRESLPGVDEDVIAAAAEALAESDSTRQAFNRDKEAAELLEDFRQVWCAHVTEILVGAHATADKAAREYRDQIQQVDQCESALERAGLNTAAAKERWDTLESDIDHTLAEIDAIEKHETYKDAGRLGELKETASAKRAAAQSALTTMQTTADQSTRESRTLQHQLESIAEDLREHQNDAAALDAEADTGEALLAWTLQSREPLRAGHSIADCGPELVIHGSPSNLRTVATKWSGIAETRTRQSEAAALAITDYGPITQLKNNAIEKERIARQNAAHAEAEAAKVQRAENETRTEARTLIEATQAWISNHRRLTESLKSSGIEEIEDSSDASWILEDIEQLTSAEPATVLSVCDAWARDIIVRADALTGALRSRAEHASQAAAQLRSTALALRQEAADLRAGRLLPLPRPDWAGVGDDELALGSALEWQQACDDPKQRALIEAAMSAAGILGATVRDDEATTRYWQVKPAGPVCAENLTRLVAVDPTHPLASVASEVLVRIRLAATAADAGIETPEALCIGEDGTFRAGVLFGRVPGADDPAQLAPATHVGARQRQAAALARAQLLDEQADSLEAQALTQENLRATWEAHADRISGSAQNLPPREELRTKESQRVAMAHIAGEAHAAAMQAQSDSLQATQDFQTAHTEWLERTRHRGLPADLPQLEQLREHAAQSAARLRKAAGPVGGKLADRLERVLSTYSPTQTAAKLEQAEAAARHAERVASSAETEVRVLEETAGTAIAEILARHQSAEERLSRLESDQSPVRQAWVDAEKAHATARQDLDAARTRLHEDIEPRAAQQLAALRKLLQVPGVTDSIFDGEQIADDEALLQQVAANTRNRKTLTIKTVLERADTAKAKLAGIWSLDPGENYGNLLTFVLTYRDGMYTPIEAAAYAQQLKARAEAALAASEEHALREFVIGRLPNAIGTAWVRLHDWVVQVNRKMQSAAASSGVGVQVRTPLRDDLPPACREVYELSCKLSAAERTPEQQRRLGQVLRSLIESAPVESMQARVADAVDIRDWVEVHYEVTRPGGTKHRWSSRTGLSGGERRLVVLAPMLAAIAAGYDRLGSNALRLLTLDEVPAEVDERGREGLARYIAALDLDLICTSYLWDGSPGAWDGIDAYDLEAGPDGTVVGFPMLVRGLSPIPEIGSPATTGKAVTEDLN